jgi:hypothetical protein
LNVKKRNGEDCSLIKKQITEISLKSGILSEFTSFIGVSEVQKVNKSSDKTPQRAHLCYGKTSRCTRAAPIKNLPNMPCGTPPSKMDKSYGASAYMETCYCAQPMKFCRMVAPPHSDQFFESSLKDEYSNDSMSNFNPTTSSLNDKSFDVSAHLNDEFFDFLLAESLDQPNLKENYQEKNSQPIQIFKLIVDSQKVGGYWEKKDQFLPYLDSGYKFPVLILKGIDSFDETTKEQIESTCIALALLRRKESANSSSWKLIELKAMKFLEKLDSTEDWNQIINSIQVI